MVPSLSILSYESSVSVKQYPNIKKKDLTLVSRPSDGKVIPVSQIFGDSVSCWKLSQNTQNHDPSNTKSIQKFSASYFKLNKALRMW